MDFSDHWALTSYYNIADVDGWSFTGGAYWARDGLDPADGALLLNENGPTTASTTISGLTPGAVYALSFLQWGDNEPGLPYAGTVSADGVQLLRYTGVDGAPGTAPGTTWDVFFTATGETATLVFGQASSTLASPIIDDIVVRSAPEPASIALLGAGLAAGAALRRRR